MKKLNIEIVVGVFALVGILCLAWLSVKLGKQEILGTNYYSVYAEFESISGLRNNAEIEVAGVLIGRVGNIALNSSGLAKVEMRIRNDFEIPDDSIISVKTRGLIGDRILSVSLGGSPKIAKQGDVLMETESVLDLESLISDFIFGKV
ncbi:MAG: outer membrane lipid asymmetry maintenance protein MlaD [Nitrospinae bacterium CG11_big_fil_rev_8_21_14_0_20_56_8]|nr:MAG: outer membrane lipid asymmetry maintenance protein MlaD [Nitrospinae bacterium CG11_big_fil_rev_8_21_14_0_20_56_8]